MRGSVRLALVFLALSSVELAAATTATGQIRSVGVSGVPEVGSSASDLDVVALAYDDKADVTLYVWYDVQGSVRNLVGRFLQFDGTIVGDTFIIAGDVGATASGARVAYSSGSSGDLFAVTYGDSVQFVRYTGALPDWGALVGSPVTVSGYSARAGDVIFNGVTDQFVVASTTAGPVALQLFNSDGSLSGGQIPIAPAAGGYGVIRPRLALDAQDGRLLLSYVSIDGPGLVHAVYSARFVIVDARTLAVSAGPTSYADCFYNGIFSPYCGQVSLTTAATFSSAAGKFVLGFATGGTNFSPDRVTARRTLVAPDGTIVDTDTVITGPLQWSGAPAVSIAYEPRSGKTIMAAVLGPGPSGQPLRGAILDAAGAPVATDLVLSASLAVASPAIVATRAGQVGAAYITFSSPQSATFERFSLSDPRSNVDGPAPGVTVGRSFTLTGWAADVGSGLGVGVDMVHAWAFPAGGGAAVFLGVSTPSFARSDVAAIFGPHALNSGYTFTTATLLPGAYTIVVYPHSSVSGQFEAGSATSVTVAVSLPRTRLDIPANGSTVSTHFTVGGWAIDQATPVGTDPGVDVVHLWAFPSTGGAMFVAAIPVDAPRTDVAGLYGSQFLNAGYRLDGATLPPGVYQVVAYAHSTVTGDFDASNSANLTVAAPSPYPVMALDAPPASATIAGQFAVAGWAADLGASSGTGVDAVHVWAFPTNGSAPIFLGVANYGGSRPDVGAIYGAAFTNSGYSLVAVFVPSGNYNLAVYAHSTVSLSFNQVKAVTIQVH
jgi:hypothetical protein